MADWFIVPPRLGDSRPYCQEATPSRSPQTLANLWQVTLRGRPGEVLCLVEHSLSYSNPAELQERMSGLANAASNVARSPR
jgi:hypothetical protein